MVDKLFKLKITRIINPHQTSLDEFSVCLFWDYENVPLSRETGETFLLALKNLADNVNLVFFKVFVRKDFINPTIVDKLKHTGLVVNIIKDNSKNAIDKAIVSSLTSVRRQIKITHVILITGDLDFRKVIIETYKWVEKIILVSRRNNTSLELTSLINTYYSIDNLINAPETWWKRSIK